MIFNRLCSHRRVLIGVLVDVWVEEAIKALVEMFIIKAWGDVLIDEVSGVEADVTINSVSEIGVEVFDLL